MKKLIGAVASALILVLVTMGHWELLLHPKVIVLYILGVIANYYQAEYNPFSFRHLKKDRGTVLQIIWTVYLTQLLALLESIYWRDLANQALDIWAWAWLAISIFGLWFRSWAYLTLGKFFTMHLEIQDGHKLVSNGPYRHLRHPSYTGAFITYVCNPLFLEAYWSTVISVLFLSWAFYRRVSYEEAMMHEEFGDTYVDFCRTRRRLLPGLW